MRQRRMPATRAAVVGGALAALVTTGVTFQTANASEAGRHPGVRTLSATAAGKLFSVLDRELGADAAGSYYDAGARTLVVDVVSDRAARTVREAGALARRVSHSQHVLDAARATLAARAALPGTSWVVDPVTNKVVITADSTVRGAALRRLGEVVRGLGDRAALRRSPGRFRPFIQGGDAITGTTGDGLSGRCSLGFNVVKDGAPYFLTAGHCTSEISTWKDSSGATLGTDAGSVFPGHDYGLVKYASADTPHPSEVDLYDGSSQQITGAGEATVGMAVTRSGSTSHVHSGTVTGLDVTVNYAGSPGGTVNGLIQTDVCAEPGDSGGSLFSGSTAVGLTSGGSGDCTSGGETFFQPVTDALSAFGVQIG
jgi:streptogrisin D